MRTRCRFLAASAALLTLGLLIASPSAWALKDSKGQVVAPASAKRIISLSPAATEILFAIGAGDAVVGVSDYCNFPPAAKALPRVGAVMTLNLEKTLSLRPDLFLTTDGNPRFYERLDRLGQARIVQLANVTLASIPTNIRELGVVTGREAAANQLAARLASGIQQVSTRAAQRKTRPRVFYMVWGEPLITAGAGSYLDDLVRAAGGENAVPRLPSANPYPPYSWEALVASDPDVILAPRHLQPTLDKLRRTQPTMKAVRSGRIVLLDDDLVSRPGPRVLEALEAVSRALAP